MPKTKDILAGMVKAGKNLAATSCLVGNPWVDHVNQRYANITSALRVQDLSDKLKELKHLRKLYSKTKRA